jgi:hypothetical protein
MSIRIGKYIFAFYITKMRVSNAAYEVAKKREAATK